MFTYVHTSRHHRCSHILGHVYISTNRQRIGLHLRSLHFLSSRTRQHMQHTIPDHRRYNRPCKPRGSIHKYINLRCFCSRFQHRYKRSPVRIHSHLKSKNITKISRHIDTKSVNTCIPRQEQRPLHESMERYSCHKLNVFTRVS